jgi:hypothetical protein
MLAAQVQSETCRRILRTRNMRLRTFSHALRRCVSVARGSSSTYTLRALSMTLRLLFFFGLSGLLVLEGCGGGDGGGGKKEEKKAFDPASANPADKVEKGCDPAKVGCCVTRANGGCPNTRCIGTAKENRIWACTANEFAVEKWGKGDNPLIKDTKGCTIDDCEAMCAENKHFPTPDGGATCIQWIFGKPDS